MVTVREMEATVERYIYEKKGANIHINIQQVIHPLYIQDQLNKLNYAYTIALEYFKNK
jgi:hypothetical protein